jgi:subtilisin family serine protease
VPNPARGRRDPRRTLILPLVLVVLGLGCVDPLSAAAADTELPIGETGFQLQKAGKSAVRLTDGGMRKATTTAAAPIKDHYIVRLAEPPVTTYTGTVAGLPRTRPVDGARFAPQSGAAKKYRSHLASTQAGLLSTLGITTKQTYTTAFNGFSARLTPAQVDRLAKDPRVAQVSQAQMLSADLATAAPAGRTATAPAGAALGRPATTSATPAHAPLGSAAGTTASTGTSASTRTTAAARTSAAVKGTGAGLVVGVLDTGIWPESASFAKTMSAPASWHGTCQEGAGFAAVHCNGKIVGARYFADGYLYSEEKLPSGEQLSARDMNGHGTHTASTAAGLPIAHAMVDGKDFGPIQGVAPDAQIAVYKVLWGGQGTDADIIAGIDAAVADGVQVLNASIGSTYGDAASASGIGYAFLNAYLAGVFVSASAGNNGETGAISNLYPWVSTVGAAVTKRNEGTVRLGDGTELVGGTLDDLPDRAARALVSATRAGSKPGADQCLPGSLDADLVRGKIVACNLGASVEDAVAEVKAKGGVGVVLFAIGGNDQVNSYFGFPVVYAASAASAGTLITYLLKHPKDATAALLPGGDGSTTPGLPSVADFSSYGPDQWHLGLQKPDLVAEGTDVVAAVSVAGDRGRAFDAFSGTSMAAPKVAGMAAVLRQEHPAWSPGTIASALRTGATDTIGTSTPLKQGSGVPSLARATDPGLAVVPSTEELQDFAGYFKEPADGRTVNQPAISIAKYPGLTPQQITRRFTNVGAGTEKYTPQISGLKGLSVTFSPKTFTLKPDETATVAITIGVGTGAWDQFNTGAITWTSTTHAVKLTVAVRAAGVLDQRYEDGVVQFPKQQLRGRTHGTASFLPGFSAPVKVRTNGYLPMASTTGSVATPYSEMIFDPKGFNVKAHNITVPENSAGLVVRLQSSARSDLDLLLYKNGKQVALSQGATSNETAWSFMPTAGTYTAYVFAAKSSVASVSYTLDQVTLGRTTQGVSTGVSAPATVTSGSTSTFILDPKQSLAGKPHWAYTWITADGKDIPAFLVSSTG